MFSFGKMFNAVVLALACSSVVTAAPWDATAKFSTHRTRELARGLTVESYHPPTTYKVWLPSVEMAGAMLTHRGRRTARAWTTRMLLA